MESAVKDLQIQAESQLDLVITGAHWEFLIKSVACRQNKMILDFSTCPSAALTPDLTRQEMRAWDRRYRDQS